MLLLRSNESPEPKEISGAKNPWTKESPEQRIFRAKNLRGKESSEQRIFGAKNLRSKEPPEQRSGAKNLEHLPGDLLQPFAATARENLYQFSHRPKRKSG
jgi:hypothetical protein